MKIQIPSNIKPKPPQDIVARLRQVNPLLGVRFVHSIDIHYWALTWDWPENDPRRRDILLGTTDPDNAWDMLCMLPLDCTVEMAYSYFVNHCRRSSKAEIKQMLDRIHTYNSDTQAAIWEPTMQQAQLEIERSASALFKDQRSFGGLEKPARRTKARLQ